MPLTWMSFALDFKFWRLNASGYHLTNLLLHSSNAVLFYFLAQRLLAKLASSDRNRHLWSAAAALLFSVHPLRVESVVWSIERKDVLSGFFYLTAVLLYLRAVDRSRDRTLCFAGSLLGYVCSLLAKPVAVSLPAALMIIDVYPLRRYRPSFQEGAIRKQWPIFKEKIPYWILSLVFGSIGYLSQYVEGNIRSLSERGWMERIVQSLYALSFYLWKMFLPIRLSTHYPLPHRIELLYPPFFIGAIVAVALTAIFFAVRDRWPAALAAWCFYVITASPMLGIVELGHQIAADHHTYLSMLAWPLLAAGWYCRRPGAGRSITPAAIVVILLVCLTWRQSEVWRDSISLWTHALAIDADNVTAHHNLGLAYAARKQMAEAASQFQEAARIEPSSADNWNDLGLAMTGLGEEEKGSEYFREALRLNPHHAYAHNNLGLYFLRQRKLSEAEKQFEAALEAVPEFEQAHNNLGIALAQDGFSDAAILHFQEAIRLNPDNAQARVNLARLSSGGRISLP